ncbi:MAG: Ig-like domain-containing protein [Candidatus Thermoplasmatota archaeon]
MYPLMSPFDVTDPFVAIIRPEKGIYLFSNKLGSFFFDCKSIVIGGIGVVASVSDTRSGIDRVEFFIDDDLRYNDTFAPYRYFWYNFVFGIHTVKVRVYDMAGD